MALALVETIYDKNFRSVPDMLRLSADSIEAETDADDKTNAMFGIQLCESGAIELYGWGGIDISEAVVLLERAKMKVIRQIEGEG